MKDEKIAVVTGSSSGIGLLTTIELARNGYRVVATMRDLGRQQRLLDAATKAQVAARLDLRRLDITEFATLPSAVDELLHAYGRIDLLVNNAGFSSGGFAEDMSLEEIRDQMETNFFGNVAMTKAVLPVMRKQKRGHIVQVSSVAGRASTPMVGAYGASKFALEGWSEALRVETYALGIRVVLVEPGAYETDIWTRNVKVSAGALKGDSPNKERSQRFAEFVKGREGRRRDATEVARLIVRVAKDPNPKLRYIVGLDARAQLVFRALAPWRLYERVLAKAVKID